MRNDTHRWSPPAPLSRTADGVALTEITGLTQHIVSGTDVVVELTGPDAFARLRMGAEVRLDQPSRSVVRQLFGCDVLLCCLADAQGFRLHLPRAHAQSLAAHLCGTDRP